MKRKSSLTTLWGALQYKLSQWWRALRHRIHPRHRYHVLPTGLAPDFYQPRDQILHAMFHTLHRFCDRQDLGACEANSEDDKEYLRVCEEIKALRDWWVWTRPLEHARLEQEYADYGFQDSKLKEDFMPLFDGSLDDHPEVIAYHKQAHAWLQEKRRLEAVDQQMLHRLVRVSPYLWD